MPILLERSPANTASFRGTEWLHHISVEIDATVIASPYGFVSASAESCSSWTRTAILLPPSGAATATIYSNAELYPQNSVGLGTYYLVTFYDQNNAPLNEPMWWQFTQAAGSTVDIGEMIPFATVGGNVIFYPTSFTSPHTDYHQSGRHLTRMQAPRVSGLAPSTPTAPSR